VLCAPHVFTSGRFTAYNNNMKSELIILCKRIKNTYKHFSRVSPKLNGGDECLTLICSGEFRITRWTSTAPRTRSHVLADEYIIKKYTYINIRCNACACQETHKNIIIMITVTKNSVRGLHDIANKPFFVFLVVRCLK